MLETERLIIRPYQWEDEINLHGILSHPDTMAFWPQPFTSAATREWLQRALNGYVNHQYGRYAIILKRNGQLIGDCGLMSSTIEQEPVIDLGYIVHYPFWGQGIGAEAAARVRDYAFQTLGLPVLHANMPSTHIASRRVAEKIGMSFIREFINTRNRHLPTRLYSVANPCPTRQLNCQT